MRCRGWLAVGGLPLAAMTAVYTAYLFAQAKARDLWQNPLLPAHLLVQALLAGRRRVLLPIVAVLFHDGRRVAPVLVDPRGLGAGAPAARGRRSRRSCIRPRTRISRCSEMTSGRYRRRSGRASR